MSAPSKKEHVTGTPIILCGFTAMESARWLPASLGAWVDEKIAGPPYVASICSQRLWVLQMLARGAMES